MGGKDVDRFQIKRGAAQGQAFGAGAGSQIGKKVQRQFPAAAKAVSFALLQNFRRKQMFNAKELKLHAPASAGGSGANEIQAALFVAVVIAGNFGDEASHCQPPCW